MDQRRFRLAASSFVIATTLLATGCSDGDPEDPGTTASSASSAAEPVAPAVEEAAQAMIDAGAIAVTIDIRAGDAQQQLALGEADLETERPAAVEDPARVASITKSVIATLVMQLVESDDLTLEDTVEQHLPGLLGERGSEVRIAQLLAHSSGLPDYLPLLAPDAEAVLDTGSRVHAPEDLVALALTQEWPTPAPAFSYSNTGYVVLGMLLEQVSGESVADLAQERVFEPLGMDATFFPDDASLPDEALHGYLDDGATRHDVTGLDPSVWSFAASLVSTPGDLSTFFGALAAGEVVSGDAVEQMVSAATQGYGYGLIVGLDPCDGGTLLGQRGNGFGYHAVVMAAGEGERVVSIVWTDDRLDTASDPLLPLSAEAVLAGLQSVC